MFFLFLLFTITNANVLINDDFSATFINNKILLNMNDHYDYTIIKYNTLVNNDNIKQIHFHYTEYDENHNITSFRTYMTSNDCTLDIINENPIKSAELLYEINKLYVSFYINKCDFMTPGHDLILEISINKLFHFDGVNNINTNDFHIFFPLNIVSDYKYNNIKITRTGDLIKMHIPYFKMFADYTFTINFYKPESGNVFNIFIISILLVFVYIYYPFF
jgi:hypothetical protein